MITEIVVVFSDTEHAQGGLSALQALQAEGILALYGSAVLVKDASGQISLQSPDSGPFGMSVGAISGGSLALLAGPLGAAIGATAGAVAGGWHEMQEDEYRSSALAQVAGQVPPGGSAVVAKVAEFGDARLEGRMRALSGLVLHAGRVEDEYQDALCQVLALRAVVDQTQADYKAAVSKAAVERDEHLAAARPQLADMAQRLSLLSAVMQQQTDGRIGQLRQQAEQAGPDTQADLEPQITQISTDHHARLTQLQEAWAGTQSALEPEASVRA